MSIAIFQLGNEVKEGMKAIHHGRRSWLSFASCSSQLAS